MLYRLETSNTVFFKEKLNVDKLDIDFFRNGEGITLISGLNGFGKSSTLELALPYRQLMSRNIKKTNSYFINGSGYIVKIWGIGSKFYEFGIHAKNNKITYSIFELNKDLTRKNPLINTSLTKDYDAFVEQLCGPQILFSRTLYKHRDLRFSNLTEAERKDFFILMMGSDIYELIKKEIHSNSVELKNKIEILEHSYHEIDPKEISDLEKNLANKKSELAICEESISALNKNIKLIFDSKLEKNKLENKIIEIKSKIENLEQLIFHINSEIDVSNKLKNDLIEQNTEVLLFIETHKHKDLLIKENQNEIDSLKRLIKEVELLELEDKELCNKYDRLNAKAKEITASDKELKRLEEIVQKTKLNLEKAKENACEVDPALCKNTFIIKNAEENYLIAENECKLYASVPVELRKEHDELTKDINDFQYKRDENKSISSIYQEKKKELESKPTLNDLLNKEKDLSKLGLTLMEKESILNSNKLDIIEYENFIMRAEDEKQNTQDLIIGHQEELNLLESQVKAINIQDNLDLEQKLITLNSQKDLLRDYYTETSFKLEQLKAEKETNDKKAIDINLLKNKYTKHQIAEEFCDKKNGIPMLKLKNAGRKITNDVNDFVKIFKDYPGLYTQIKLITEKIDSQGKKVNTFDIHIIGENGKERSIASLSSGQNILIEIALSYAINTQIVKNFKTMLIDELDGTLDDYNIILYYEMLRTIKNSSNIKQMFVVSHRQESKDFGDAEIILEKNIGVRYS